MNISVPTLDFSDLIEGDKQQKDEFCKDIGNAYHDIGFVVLKNHGITKELREKLYEQLEKFFSLPEEEKRKYEFTELAGQRGFTGKGKEKAVDAKTPDLKEFFQYGQFTGPDENVKEKYPENIYVKELPELNEVAKEIYTKLEFVGREVLRALALYIGLEENYFDDKIYLGNSILRLIHYFPLANRGFDPGAVRAAAHEDINLITLLIGASAEGLEVLRRDGEWIPINAGEDELVINVGDMLQRLTNNKLRSTTHRVVNPPKEKWHLPRYSTPFFLHPQSSMDLSCLNECINSENPKHYEDISAGEYLNERLEKIGLKK